MHNSCIALLLKSVGIQRVEVCSHLKSILIEQVSYSLCNLSHLTNSVV